MSSAERELLQRAVSEGYFRVPRQVSLVDLADQQGISDREASEHLRTGVETVLRHHLGDETDTRE